MELFPRDPNETFELNRYEFPIRVIFNHRERQKSNFAVSNKSQDKLAHLNR